MKLEFGDRYYVPLICAEGAASVRRWGDNPDIDLALLNRGHVFIDKNEAQECSQKIFYEVEKRHNCC